MLITGAGRGIGKRLAIGLAKQGCRIGLLGRSFGELDSTRFEIEDNHGVSAVFNADVRDYLQVEQAATEMSRTLGPIDALIANAGVLGSIGPFAESSPNAWLDVLNTNVIGVMNSCRAVLPGMIHRRSGKILVISGQGAANPRPDFAAYAASKAAIGMFVESLAEEVRDANVQVNSMHPGEAYTSMTDEILDAADLISQTELDHARQARMNGGIAPEKQTQLAHFLISDRSNHLTGKLIHIQDDLRKLEHDNCRLDAFTIRRHVK